MSGINLDEMAATVLTRHDFFFSRVFAIPHLCWVFIYSTILLGYIPIENPPQFVEVMLVMQTFGTIVVLIVWYFICYSNYFTKYFDNNEDQEEKAKEEVKVEEANIAKALKGRVVHNVDDDIGTAVAP